jgi:serine/threonine-protein kinase
VRVLGQGGMGIVVQAMHLQLHQPVAMKFLLPEVLGNQQVVQRFLREAQAAVRLKSEHVARVIDVGSLETGAPYMVLEYLEGADLSNVSRAQLTVGGIVDLMLQACEALAEAHSLGIVHRDVKPANFFITRGADGAPLLKVLDFGISKTPVTGSNLTATQAVMGTPAYMSPEQMRSSRDVDHRSDIWALGVVLYELLQGAPPFGGDTFSSMVIKVVTDPLPQMTVQLPGDLAAIVYRCLEKDPARRFQNVAELAHALAPYAQTETQASISVQRTRSIIGLEAHRSAAELGPARRAIPPSTLSGAAGAKQTMPMGGRRWPIFAGLGVLTCVVTIAFVASNGGASDNGKKVDGLAPAARSDIAAPPAAVAPPAPPPAAVTPPAPPPAAVTPPAPPPAPHSPRDTVAATPLEPTMPPPATTPPPAMPQPVATAQSASPTGASPGSTIVIPPADTMTKKTKKPTKPGAGSKPNGSTAKPQASPDEDVLGTRN